MSANYSQIRELLQQRADMQARINLMPYDGNPEIKEVSGSKYLYIRKRVAGKLTSTYVDVYSDELYQLLLRNAKERKDLNKSIRRINKELVALGYEDEELPARILQNLEIYHKYVILLLLYFLHFYIILHQLYDNNYLQVILSF